MTWHVKIPVPPKAWGLVVSWVDNHLQYWYSHQYWLLIWNLKSESILDYQMNNHNHMHVDPEFRNRLWSWIINWTLMLIITLIFIASWGIKKNFSNSWWVYIHVCWLWFTMCMHVGVGVIWVYEFLIRAGKIRHCMWHRLSESVLSFFDPGQDFLTLHVLSDIDLCSWIFNPGWKNYILHMMCDIWFWIEIFWIFDPGQDFLTLHVLSDIDCLHTL